MGGPLGLSAAGRFWQMPPGTSEFPKAVVVDIPSGRKCYAFFSCHSFLTLFL